MELLLKRIAKKPTYTIGKLYINGEYFCDTLEDTDRELTDKMPLSAIKKIKVKGETAIPTGEYQVLLNTFSPKFGKKIFYKEACGGYLPRLPDVKGFSGILIHCGNSALDSEGCILVGENKVVGRLVNSQITFKKLYERLKKASEKGNSIKLKIN